jgi:hypothetical protein
MPVSPVFPSGGSGGGIVNLLKYNCTSQIDGTTTTFIIEPSYVSGSLQVYWNGLLQMDEDITQDSSTVFTTSFIPQVGDHLVVIYLH